jgi:hypothetical protein
MQDTWISQRWALSTSFPQDIFTNQLGEGGIAETRLVAGYFIAIPKMVYMSLD